MPAMVFSAPGKTIFFGEHAVVYGFPAIAVPLIEISVKISIQALPDEDGIHIVNRNLGEDFFLDISDKSCHYQMIIMTILNILKINHLPSTKITISSTIPVASGLGSSAAFAVAMTKAISSFLGFKLPFEKINEIAFEIEKFQHGTPSGIDNSVVTFQKPVFFQKDTPIEFLSVGKSLHVILADSGIRSFTKKIVEELKIERDKHPEQINMEFKEIKKITTEAKEMIESGNLKEVGLLMTENHRHLQNLGLSCQELDHLVDVAVKAGAYGAKLCGSGKGGNVVALINEDKIKSIHSALIKEGAASCLYSKVRAA